MCELLGISSSQPTGWREVLCPFRLRGGGTADNPDGWGLAYREDGGFQLRKQPTPAVRSRLFLALCDSVRSDLVVAHVRKARLPPVNAYRNTHPFKRVCCARQWVFAHNGLVPEVIGEELSNPSRVCRPTGATDSEHAFCRVLGVIAEQFTRARPDAPASWFEAVASVSEVVASHGKFNFLMSDGAYLIAYGHDRLHHLQHLAPRTRGATRADITLIATEPFTADEGWRRFEPGELRIYRLGRLIDRIKTAPPPVASDGTHSRPEVLSAG
jgi:glutamine amidotransferase